MRLLFASALALAAVPALAQIPNSPAQPGAAQATRVPAGTYQVDPAHTQVAWEVNHMGFSILEGLFGASGGSITVDPAKPAAAKVDVTFNVADLSVTSGAFANHLKSDQIFDAAKYPTARFVSTSVTSRGGNRATIAGNLTIKNITKPVTLDATFIGAGTNPMSKKLNFGFTATTTVKRSDFGVGLAAPVVSDEVKLHIHAAFTAA
ncbi:Polyisoprenoid-binding protein YceI [Sphingomonas gellani]|uniref:Polyisoprenoid-binding protein YceI n=1 Tax=Sphingomonas gellani TaxID=1166340 RepID=A0A1H7Y5I8_9SPHN|nr:YceI family protein [Sphingomonas gellani]SEM41400.1 Polyisoprenoid-binding protein YceI [Sphingomonas gellani]